MHKDTNDSVKQAGPAKLPSTPIYLPDGTGPLGAMNELESHFGAIKRMHAEVAEREAILGEQLVEMGNRRRELEQELAAVKADRAAVASEKEELQSAQADILSKLGRIDAAKRELESKTQQAAAEREQIERDHAAAKQLAEELEDRESRVQSGLLQIEAREQTIAAQARKLEAEQSAREAVVREKEIAVSQREKTAGKDAEQLRREIESLKQRLAADGDDAAGARSRAEALQQQLDSERAASESHLADVQTRLAEATAALAARDAQISNLRSELERVQDRLKEAEATLTQQAKASASAAPTPDFSKYETAIKLLTERLKKADADKQSLTQQLEHALDAAESRNAVTASSATATEYSARVQLRRARLKRYKGLLQAQARKLMHAQSALAKRQTEAEQVVSQRSRIVAAMTALQRREAEVNKQKSGSATAAMMFYAVAGLAVLLALSWAAAYKIAPATYAARAVLSGDGQGRVPSDPECIAWQQYVQSLVNDPQIIEQTAERLDRRGIGELASGGTLRAELASNLYSDISTPKSITFEIRGDNATRTEIVLDTLVGTIVGSANATRTQRPDGITAEVTQPASIGDGPINDQRLMYTGGIFAGSATLFLSCGLVIGRRLNRLKQSARSDDLIDDALSGSDEAESD